MNDIKKSIKKNIDMLKIEKIIAQKKQRLFS